MKIITAYRVRSKETMDILSEDATQPAISRDGKRVMYVTLSAPQINELWLSDVDGRNKVRIATGHELSTGSWAPDGFHLSFFESGVIGADKAYSVGADGRGLRQIPSIGAMPIAAIVWSQDQKSIY